MDVSTGSNSLAVWWIGGVGALFAVVNAIHATRMTSVLGVALEALLPLGLAILVVGGAVWVGRTVPETHHQRRIGAWTVLGILGLLVVASWTVGHQVIRGEAVDHVWFIAANNATAGALIGLLIGVYDVRNRQATKYAERSETAAKQERDRMRALFANAPNAILLYTVDGGTPVVRDANPAFEGVFGVAIDQVLGRPVDDVVGPADYEQTDGSVGDRIVAGEHVRTEVDQRTPTGRRELLLVTAPIGPDAGFAIATDITDERTRQQRLQVLNRVLRHDLRNGMNVVLGYADLLASGHLTPEDGANRITRRARELLALGDRARTFDRIETAATTRLDAVELLTNHVERIERKYPDAEISVERHVDSAPVRANGVFGLAIDDIVENAIEHNESATARVSVSVTTTDGAVVMRFRDNGSGIPARELAVIENGRETPLEHAAGLGLWLINWVVTDHGGTVTFDTGDDGTTVTLRLPVADSDGHADADSSTDRSAIVDSMTDPTRVRAGGGTAGDGNEDREPPPDEPSGTESSESSEPSEPSKSSELNESSESSELSEPNASE